MILHSHFDSGLMWGMRKFARDGEFDKIAHNLRAKPPSSGKWNVGDFQDTLADFARLEGVSPPSPMPVP